MTAQQLIVTGSPNQLSDRAAMGMPEHWVSRLPADTFPRNRALLAATPDELVEICGCRTEPFGRRYVAGSLLAMIGDSRIRPQEPDMVEIPAAVVRLGLPFDQVDRVVERWQSVGVLTDWIRKECPQHEATVAAFRLMRYPVTNLEYRRFLADTAGTASSPDTALAADGAGPQLPSSWRFGCYPAQLANHPVWTVRPKDADAYAAWLAARTGRAFRLPTEAEWEYAASGGDPANEYPWGATVQPDHANTVEDGPLCTTPIGCYPAGRSPFGIEDLAGNVEEYVADDYAPYPGGDQVTDDLLVGGSYRIARGGSFTRFGDLTRCTRRHGWFDRSIYAIGFRLAETI